MAVKLTISHEFSGMGDYWGGNGRRWDDNAGCAFAYYGAGTTLRECVDQWVDDVWQGGDFEYHGDGCDPWEDVTEDDIRAAILNDFLNDRGRADYESGALAECAVEYAEVNGIDADNEDEDYDDCSESPIWVILIEVETCADCGKGDEHVIDDICAECAAKHGYDLDDGKFVVGERVMIDGLSGYDEGYAYGEIVKITDTSVFVDVAGRRFRRGFDDVYPLNENNEDA